MNNERKIAIRRLLAFALDWFVIALWGGLLFGVVMLATGGGPAPPENPWTAQALGFLTMTLPVTVYFALCESSSMRASLGKRLLGLVVSRESGERLSFASALLRNAGKFVPWELGHTVALQAALSGDAAFPMWVWGPLAVAFAGPLRWLVTVVATGRTPYDRWASARVTSQA
ncbi:MAG: hypothetical protein GC161_11280 [Planctomycetaceae bacterium]|nr:hypothetical protein [Planctomycetaceae bacterium]